MVATQIYQDLFQSFNFPKAAAMASLLIVLSMLVLWPVRRIERAIARSTVL